METHKEEAGGGRQPDGMLVMRTLAMPRDTNPGGDIFGGLIAKEVARGRVVTVTVDK